MISPLSTTLPQNLIKEKLTAFIEQTFNKEGSLYLAANEKHIFFTSEQPKRYHLWACQKVCDALHYLFDNIFMRPWKDVRNIRILDKYLNG